MGAPADERIPEGDLGQSSPNPRPAAEGQVRSGEGEVRFTYEYRTSDNALHKGVIDASDRDAVYVALRARGIKPSRVDEAPGLFNKLFGIFFVDI